MLFAGGSREHCCKSFGMEIYTILALAVGLAMDAVAVSITAGASVKRLSVHYAFLVAFTFGLFQGLMPVIGWLVGTGFHAMIESVDHWIAFILLGLIGGRMIYHDWRGGDEEEHTASGAPKSLSALLLLALATSVDAAVAGISFIVLNSILTPAVVIAVVTFALCSAGIVLGHRYKGLAGKQVNTVGGVILISIGTKILLEHLST